MNYSGETQQEKKFIQRYKKLDKNGRRIKTEFQKEKLKMIDQLENINLHSKFYVNWMRHLISYFKELQQDDIIFDVIHMLCNRVIGIDRNKENQYMIELSVIVSYLMYNS